MIRPANAVISGPKQKKTRNRENILTKKEIKLVLKRVIPLTVKIIVNLMEQKPTHTNYCTPPVSHVNIISIVQETITDPSVPATLDQTKHIVK